MSDIITPPADAERGTGNAESTAAELPEREHNIGNTIRASWPFQLNDLRANISTYSDDVREMLVNVFLWCTDPKHPIGRQVFSARIGLSMNTTYKIFTGKYTHPQTGVVMPPSADTIEKIEEFLNREREIFLSGLKDFVSTPTSRRIVTACNLARESHTPVFLVGPSHIGKTWTLERHYAPNNNHGSTPYIRMGAASGLGGMVKRIATGLSISEKSNTSDLIRRIKGGLTTETLPILDEMHLLAHTYRKGSFHNCMEVIREIYDEVGCGMVLVFTMLDDVRAASQKELQQLWRRGIHKVILPDMPTKGDVSAILEHHGLEFPDKKLEVKVKIERETFTDSPYKILKQIVATEALKAVTERVRYAKKIAAKENDGLAWEHFVKAHLHIASQANKQSDWD